MKIRKLIELKDGIWSLQKKERISHAGFEISFETPNKTYNFNFYDVRHWDKDEERWLEPGEEWERSLRETAERASLEQALERINKWVKRNDLENFLNEKYETPDIQEIVSDVSEDSKLDAALDLFYALLQRKMRGE